MKGEDMKFVRQSQTIKVTNVDNKVQTEKEVRSMEICCRFLYAVLFAVHRIAIKQNVLISLLESPYSLRFENVYVYLKSLKKSIILHFPIIVIEFY